jgi:hypothetical protein
MRKIFFLALMAVLSICGNAAGADGVYVLSSGVGTRIATLPYTITSPGYYCFSGNLSIDLVTGNAITVNADNVTIDLMGFSLTNTHSTRSANGIRMNSRNNVEVRNGAVINFQEGIYESSVNGANHRITNVRLHRNGDSIFLRGKGHLARDCTASNNYNGIILDAGAIMNSQACENMNIGIALYGHGSVLNNVAQNNNVRNFYLGFQDTVTKIMVHRNSASGLATNYSSPSGSTGVLISDLNAGKP